MHEQTLLRLRILPLFTAALLGGCQDAKVHTAIDSSMISSARDGAPDNSSGQEGPVPAEDLATSQPSDGFSVDAMPMAAKTVGGPSNGKCTTWSFGSNPSPVPASSPVFYNPVGMAMDRNGALYVADVGHHVIFKMSNGMVEIAVGQPGGGYRDGPAGQALSHAPYDVAVDDQNNLYYVDELNHRLRRLSGGQVTTLAGSGPTGFTGGAFLDGPADQARFNRPKGIAIDRAGHIYIADMDNNRIRMYFNGVVSTIAGSVAGYRDGSADKALFDHPYNVAWKDNKLFVADTYNHRIRTISFEDDRITVSTLAGSGATGINGGGFADGPSAQAQFSFPVHVELDDHDHVFVSDLENRRLRLIADGQVTTYAGDGHAGCRDGQPAWKSRFAWIAGLAIDQASHVLVSDYVCCNIRLIAP